MAKKGRSKQTGTPNTKKISAAFRSRTTLNPWGGPNIPQKTKGNKVTGGSRKKPTPDPALFNMPPRPGGVRGTGADPLAWNVVPDTESYTLPPSTSGLSTTVANAYNAALEHAYTRAGYQSVEDE